MKASRLLVLLLIACAKPPMTAPAPMTVEAPLAPAQAIQRAAQRLTMEGFTVTASDATAGIVTATLTRTGQGDYGPLLACRYGPDAIGRRGMTTVLTARVAATPAASGASVTIGTSTMTTYGRESASSALGGSSASASDCASTGEIERRLVAALGAP